jgi:hypothetical protein
MNINPTTSVNLPLSSEVNELTISVNPFDLFPNTISVTWKVSGPTITREGLIELPKIIVDTWGTDDTIVKDYVLTQLGLTESN